MGNIAFSVLFSTALHHLEYSQWRVKQCSAGTYTAYVQSLKRSTVKRICANSWWASAFQSCCLNSGITAMVWVHINTEGLWEVSKQRAGDDMKTEREKCNMEQQRQTTGLPSNTQANPWKHQVLFTFQSVQKSRNLHVLVFSVQMVWLLVPESSFFCFFFTSQGAHVALTAGFMTHHNREEAAFMYLKSICGSAVQERKDLEAWHSFYYY